MKKLTIVTAVLIFISCDLITKNLQEEIDELRNQTEQLQEDVTALQEEINSLEGSNTDLEAEIDSLGAQVDLLNASLEVLISEVDSSNAELLSIIESLQTQIEMLQARIYALEFPPVEFTDMIVFFRYTDSYTPDARSHLCIMDPDNPENVEMIFHNEPREYFDTGTLAKDPIKNRVVFGKIRTSGRGHDLYLYNGDSRTAERILENNGISWMASWSPNGEWIAYVDDARVKDHAADELALINPDTKEIIWLSGDSPKEEFYGFHPSWDPTGERIAMGSAHFSNPSVRRIGIYSNLFDEPTRKRLHTEDKIMGFYPSSSIEGINGVAWSPDGELIAYNVVVNGGQKLFIANADGSGIVSGPILGANPSWSPDGQYLIFSKSYAQGSEGLAYFHICRVNRDGEDFVDLSLMSASEPNDVSPKWAN